MKIVARRNKLTKKIFVEFEEEFLISPEGKEIEIDLERFGEPEEVYETDLTEKQLKAFQGKIDLRESQESENLKKVELEKRLFKELKKERKRLADEQGVPAYIIFHDKTLMEMSEIMPCSESTMRQVSGVGSEKFRLYGTQFINVVKKFKIDFKLGN